MKKLLAFLLMGSMLIGCSSGNKSGVTVTTEKKSEKEVEEIVEKEPNPDYIELVKNVGFDDINFEFEGLESDVFGHMVDEISLELLAFGYKHDAVNKMTNAMYYNLTDLDASQIAALDEYLQELAEPFRGLDFCDVTCEQQDDNTYVLKLEYSDMDNNDHIKKVVEVGGLQLTEDSAENIIYLSFKDTASSLAQGGWIQR